MVSWVGEGSLGMVASLAGTWTGFFFLFGSPGRDNGIEEI